MAHRSGGREEFARQLSIQPRATRASPGALRHLPTSARPVVDARDIAVPDGYRVEAVLVGLSFPCGMAFGEDGTLYLAEGGTTWPTRPWMPSRLLSLSPAGEVKLLAVEEEAGLRGLAVRDGAVYAACKGGYRSRVVRYDLATGERRVLFDQMPDGGWHEPGGPAFGPDGLLYFAQGSVAQQGIIEPAGWTVDIARHPRAHDVPGEDVVLTGNNLWTTDPVIPFADMVETGAFKPFGVPARKGEVVKGELWCSTGLWRARPDGTQPELVAWGLRNPYGLAFSGDGELYVSDNDFEERGNRAVGEDPDRVWHVKGARLPHGSITRPEWFGYPDLAGDGLPLWHERHLPNRGRAAQPLLENPPPFAGPAAVLLEPHGALAKMDFCRSDAFGFRDQLFLCQWGTLAPLNTTREEALGRGSRVLRIDVKTGEVTPFLHNRHRGPAIAQAGSGGLEHPVDCRFHPDGRSLYVLDFGTVVTPRNMQLSYAHTGVVWRITRT